MLTTYILSSPNPVTHPQFYDCSKFFSNQTDRPILNETIPDEKYETINDISRYLVLYFFCVLYVLRALIEGSLIIFVKVKKRTKTKLKFYLPPFLGIYSP